MYITFCNGRDGWFDFFLRVVWPITRLSVAARQVLEAIATYPNICRQLHLPAQSGSTAVLVRLTKRSKYCVHRTALRITEQQKR